MSQIDQIEKLLNIASSLEASKLDDLYGAIATRIAGAGTKDLAEALSEITAAGEDPNKFIPVSPSHIRLMREQARQQRAQELHEIELERQKIALERERIELQKLQAGADALTGAAQRIATPAPVS